MSRILSYLKVKIAAVPAWEIGGTLSTELEDVTNVSVSLNRGLTPNTAEFIIKNTGDDCDYAGMGVEVTAVMYEGGTGLEDKTETYEIFKGFITERTKILSADSLTHIGWRFQCEDVMATWEAYEYNIELSDPNGIAAGDIAPDTRPPKFEDYGGTFDGLVSSFKCQGNAIDLFAEMRKQDGHVPSASGSLDGLPTNLSSLGGVKTVNVTETVPEAEGVKLSFTNNAVFSETEEMIKVIFIAKSQQWWVPIAWNETLTNESTGEDTYHFNVIYQTSIKHSQVTIESSEEMPNPYSKLYFDDEEQAFTVIQESDIVSTDTGTNPNYDYTSLEDVTLVQPEGPSIYTDIFIKKSYEFSEEPEDEEKAGASILAQFKKELPDIMTLHIPSTAITAKELEYEAGSEPFSEEDGGSIRDDSSLTNNPVESYADERLAEMKYTDERVYEYTYGLQQSVPIPAHGAEQGSAVGDSDFIVESTFLSWNGDGVDITVTVRSESLKTATYNRVSKYSMARYFKKQVTASNKLDKIKEANYAKIVGDEIIFTITNDDGDEEDIHINLTDNILTDDGIVRW